MITQCSPFSRVTNASTKPKIYSISNSAEEWEIDKIDVLVYEVSMYEAEHRYWKCALTNRQREGS